MKATSTDISTTLSSIRDYIRWSASRFTAEKLFFGHGTATALDEACALVLYSLNQPYNLSADYFSATLTMSERLKVIDIIERRIEERIPAAYLTHEAIFAGLSFYVDDRVLVPRSPMAELIEDCFSPWVDVEQVDNILDLCTGSGCIAIACAYGFPDANIDAVDLSAEALAVAKINHDKHDLQGQLQLIESDLFDKVADKKYDLIVSNPPYVAISEWQQLPSEYHAEPEMGFTGGESGLDLVFKILAESADYLTETGVLFVEVGSSAETLQKTFPNVPFYWLEFERGGDGVFMLSYQQLKECAEEFKAVL